MWLAGFEPAKAVSKTLPLPNPHFPTMTELSLFAYNHIVIMPYLGINVKNNLFQ